jgi:hypothetical protein
VALGVPVATTGEPAEAPRTTTVKVQEVLALIRAPLSEIDVPPVAPDRDPLVQLLTN